MTTTAHTVQMRSKAQRGWGPAWDQTARTDRPWVQMQDRRKPAVKPRSPRTPPPLISGFRSSFPGDAPANLKVPLLGREG